MGFGIRALRHADKHLAEGQGPRSEACSACHYCHGGDSWGLLLDLPVVPPGFLTDVSRKALEVRVYARTRVHAKQAGKTFTPQKRTFG